MHSSSSLRCIFRFLFLVGLGTLTAPLAQALQVRNDDVPAQPAADPHAGHNHDHAHNQGAQTVDSRYRPEWGEVSSLGGGPLIDQYRTAVRQLKEDIKGLRKILVTHHAEMDPKAPLFKYAPEWNEKRKSAFANSIKFRQAAIELYASDPKKYKSVGDLLFGILMNESHDDRYEGLPEIAKVLIETSYPDNQFWEHAFHAAAATNQYSLIDEWSRKAFLSGITDNPAPAILIPESYQAKWQQELAIREAEAKADDLPRVRIQTNKGDIIIELFENEAPNTVANFIYLAEHGYYNELSFFRVLERFMLQAGCINGDGGGSPGYRIECEAGLPNARTYFRGSLAMALAGDPNTGAVKPDTGGSQFFISLYPNPKMVEYTVFGRVIEGIEILGDIERVDFSDEKFKKDNPDTEPDIMIKVEVIRKRDHEYVPKIIDGRLPF